jgi:hypothetical protein
VLEGATATTDEDDNRYNHQPNGHSPLENIIGEGNHRNSVVQRPLLDAFQHQEAMVPPATPGSGQENVDDEALHTTSASTNNYVLINPLENTNTTIDLGGLTSNITILALAATAASVEQRMLPWQQQLPVWSNGCCPGRFYPNFHPLPSAIHPFKNPFQQST